MDRSIGPSMVRRATQLHLDETVILDQVEMSEWRARWTKILIDPIYLGVLAIINLTFTVILVMADRITSFWQDEHFTGVIVVGIILNCLYIFDLIANFVVLGFKNIVKERKYIFYECFLQLMLFTWLICIATGKLDRNKDGYYTDIALLFILRNVRAVSFASDL